MNFKIKQNSSKTWKLLLTPFLQNRPPIAPSWHSVPFLDPYIVNSHLRVVQKYIRFHHRAWRPSIRPRLMYLSSKKKWNHKIIALKEKLKDSVYVCIFGNNFSFFKYSHFIITIILIRSPLHRVRHQM